MEMVITKAAKNTMKSNAVNVLSQDGERIRGIFLPKGWESVTVDDDGFVTVHTVDGQIHGFKAAQARLVNARD